MDARSPCIGVLFCVGITPSSCERTSRYGRVQSSPPGPFNKPRYALSSASTLTALVRPLAGLVAALSIVSAGTAFALSNVTPDPVAQPQFQAPLCASAEWMGQLRMAMGKLQAGDAKGAEAGLVTISQAPDLANAPPKLRYTVCALLTSCEEAGGETEAAYANLIKAGEILPDARNRDYWRALMVAANAVHQDYVAVDALGNAITADAARANDIDVGSIEEILGTTHGMKDGGIHRRMVLETLWQVKVRAEERH
jgi:hypothetical protein